MADFITKIRTESGDLLYDFYSLGNLPKFDTDLIGKGNFADAKAAGDWLRKLQSVADSYNAATVNGQLIKDSPVLTPEDIGALAAVGGKIEGDIEIGGAMSVNGAINMQGNNIGGLSEPKDDDDAVTKKYADTKSDINHSHTLAFLGAQEQHVSKTVSLKSDSWSDKQQTVNCDGVTGINTVIVGGHPLCYIDYAKSNVYCTGQGENTLTFTCEAVPTIDLEANIIILT